MIQVNTTFQSSNRHCLACFGRDKNSAIDPNCNYTNSNDCLLMQELINTSCIHRSGYSWCRGKWDPNRLLIPFILRKNRRQYNQFKAQLEGRPYIGARIANGPRFQDKNRPLYLKPKTVFDSTLQSNLNLCDNLDFCSFRTQYNWNSTCK